MDSGNCLNNWYDVRPRLRDPRGLDSDPSEENRNRSHSWLDCWLWSQLWLLTVLRLEVQSGVSPRCSADGSVSVPVFFRCFLINRIKYWVFTKVCELTVLTLNNILRQCLKSCRLTSLFMPSSGNSGVVFSFSVTVWVFMYFYFLAR